MNNLEYLGTRMLQISGSTVNAKLSFEAIHDLILSEDVHKHSVRETSSSLLSIEDR